MAILLIVIQILSALPTIIKVIKDILSLIHQVPAAQGKAMFQSRFQDILQSIKDHRRFTAEHGAQLDSLYTDLKAVVK